MQMPGLPPVSGPYPASGQVGAQMPAFGDVSQFGAYPASLGSYGDVTQLGAYGPQPYGDVSMFGAQAGKQSHARRFGNERVEIVNLKHILGIRMREGG